jgi:tetratricopeptide (TPR) repeat protein
VPDEKDLEHIKKMLEELGETELDLGEITEEEYLTARREAAARREASEIPEAEPVTADEEGGEDFDELLKDIEIGLSEERELEERMAAPREGAPPEIVPAPGEEEAPVIPSVIEEALAPAEELGVPEEEAPVIPETEAAIEEALAPLEGLEKPGEEEAPVIPETEAAIEEALAPLEGLEEPGEEEAPVRPETEAAIGEALAPPEEAVHPEDLITEKPAGEEEVPLSVEEIILPEEESVIPGVEIPSTLPPTEEEAPVPDLEIPGVEPEEPGAEKGKEEEEEFFPSLEALLGEEKPTAAGEAQPGEIPFESVPEETPGEEITPGEVPFESIPDEVSLEEIPPEEMAGEEVFDEDALDLPIDFDLDDLTVKEGPPGAAEPAVKPAEAKPPEEKPELEEEPAEAPAPPVSDEIGIPEIEVGPEAGPAEEPVEGIEEAAAGAGAEGPMEGALPPELEEGLADLLAPGEAAPTEEPSGEKPPAEAEIEAEQPEAPVEGIPTEQPPPSEIEDISLADLEVIGLQEEGGEEVPSELPSIEDLGEEALGAGQKPESELESELGLIEEPSPGVIERIEEAAGPELPEVPEIEEEEAAAEGGGVMELSEDDIGRIKTKLSTLNPVVASVVQEIIVKGTLPVESMNGVLELLILDADEAEIIQFVEKATGRKLVPPRVRPAVPVVGRRPGVLGALAENLGPFIRAAMLFAVIVVVLGALFMAFLFNPILARRHYRQGLELLREARRFGPEEVDLRRNYLLESKEQFREAERFHEKMPNVYRGIAQYDGFGWELMLAGSLNDAQTVFEEGIRREIDKGKAIGNLRLFMRLAILHNLLGNYEEAEHIYAWVLNRHDGAEKSYPRVVAQTEMFQGSGISDGFERSRRLAERVAANKAEKYSFTMLRGENLAMLAEEVIDQKVRQELLGKAYLAFDDALKLRSRDAAPLFKKVQVAMMGDEDETVDLLVGEINRRFPKAVDPEVQTELARYYVQRNQTSPVRDLLLKVLNRRNLYYPYPPAYYAFAEYHNAVGNSDSRQEFLNSALEAERRRVLPKDWNYRDRTLFAWSESAVGTVPLFGTGRAGADGDMSRDARDISAERFPWDVENRQLISDAYNGLGEIYASGNAVQDVAQAIGYFKKAIDTDPTHARATFNLAQMYFYHVRDFGLAKSYYRRFDRLQRNGNLRGSFTHDLHYNLGYIYHNERQFNTALRYWSDLSLSMPENPHIISALGNTLLHLNDYAAALGEYLLLSEMYDRLVDGLGEIRPWRDYHQRIILESAGVHNNLGVAYYMLGESTADENQRREYERNALLALYKAGELADMLGAERGEIQYNIQKIIHPAVARAGMAIHDELSDNFRFAVQ